MGGRKPPVPERIQCLGVSTLSPTVLSLVIFLRKISLESSYVSKFFLQRSESYCRSFLLEYLELHILCAPTLLPLSIEI